MDRGVILRDRELRPIKMIGGMADISERVKLEEHLQQNQRIESIGKLTGGLAHDFNNLLTVMLGNAELLGSCASDALQKKLAGNIVSSALKGADLTRRLLAFARRQSLEPAAVNVNKLVQGMEGLLMRALGENIDVVIKTSANLNTALADRNQLESALLNLCINARDAMPGGGQIRIETFDITLMANAPGIMERVIPGDYVAIKVIDTGTGIEAELLPHVFEPFFTTKELGKGTGLGLSTVFGFIRQSNGHVTITSTPGSGTAVVLYLPITQHQEKAADANNPESYALGNETILLVEDDANVRNFSSHFLQSLGYQVIVAENGATALDILIGRNDINLLFTDIIMAGGIDGSELARRALALRPALKVLYTSGYTDNALLKEGMLDSSENFLAKPYTLAKMALRIRDSLDKHNDG
jgi:nitrogen-specific signal transduction histidine kinase/CheY-like chemotaxis protein